MHNRTDRNHGTTLAFRGVKLSDKFLFDKSPPNLNGSNFVKTHLRI